MRVIAAPGIQCPMENTPRGFISDSEAVDVPESAFYLRRIADGDLLPAASTALAKIEPKSKGK